MATVTVVTPPAAANTTSALSQVETAYNALSIAMRNLLDDQALLNPAPAATTPPAASPATPVPTPPMLGFETIDKEIKILYSAIAQVSKIQSRIKRRSTLQAPAGK